MRQMKWIIKYSWLMMVWAATAVFLTSCSNNPAIAESDGRLQVVATIGQVADAARIVGGDHVVVTGLMGPGVDPHLYTASESDVSKLSEADIIFYNGLFLEAQMAGVLKQIGERKTAVPAAEAIPVEKRLASPVYQNAHDPHVWFDVQLWQYAVKAIRDTYITADPDHAADYEANAAAYLAELESLDQYVRDTAAKLPPEQRILITAHDAFGYFGQAYGFEVRGLQGISTASEASTSDVQLLANYIVEKQIKAVFIESSVPVRTIEAVQAAVAAQGHTVNIGGELFSDALGNADTPEGSYIGVVRHNIDTIVAALLGQ